MKNIIWLILLLGCTPLQERKKHTENFMEEKMVFIEWYRDDHCRYGAIIDKDGWIRERICSCDQGYYCNIAN